MLSTISYLLFKSMIYNFKSQSKKYHLWPITYTWNFFPASLLLFYDIYFSNKRNEKKNFFLSFDVKWDRCLLFLHLIYLQLYLSRKVIPFHVDDILNWSNLSFRESAALCAFLYYYYTLRTNVVREYKVKEHVHLLYYLYMPLHWFLRKF